MNSHPCTVLHSIRHELLGPSFREKPRASIFNVTMLASISFTVSRESPEMQTDLCLVHDVGNTLNLLFHGTMHDQHQCHRFSEDHYHCEK